MVRDLSKHIDEIIGKPFQLHGRGPEAFDCFGVVHHLARVALGVDLPDPMGEACARRIEDLQGRFIQLPNLACLEPGDVVRMSGIRGISEQCVAFAENAAWLVTAKSGVGVYRTRLSRLPDYPSIEGFRLKECFT